MAGKRIWNYTKLTDVQFDEMTQDLRRSLIEQLMFIDTPKFFYAIGAQGNLWTLIQYDKRFCTGKNKHGSYEFTEDYNPRIIDSWV